MSDKKLERGRAVETVGSQACDIEHRAEAGFEKARRSFS